MESSFNFLALAPQSHYKLTRGATAGRMKKRVRRGKRGLPVRKSDHKWLNDSPASLYKTDNFPRARGRTGEKSYNIFSAKPQSASDFPPLMRRQPSRIDAKLEKRALIIQFQD